MVVTDTAQPRAGGGRAGLRQTVWSGLLAGVGVVAFVDETVFHQLLHWHHFYDKTTLAVGLVSDGIFHAVGFTAMVVGLFLLADAARQLYPEAVVGFPAARRRRLPALRRDRAAQDPQAAPDPV